VATVGSDKIGSNPAVFSDDAITNEAGMNMTVTTNE